MVNKLPINWSLLWAALRDFCVTYFYYVYTWQWQWLWPRFFYSLCNKLFFILPLLIIVAFPLFYLRNDCYYIVWDERNTRGVYIVNRRVYTYKHDAASTRINLQDRMEEKIISLSPFFFDSCWIHATAATEFCLVVLRSLRCASCFHLLNELKINKKNIANY